MKLSRLFGSLLLKSTLLFLACSQQSGPIVSEPDSLTWTDQKTTSTSDDKTAVASVGSTTTSDQSVEDNLTPADLAGKSDTKAVQTVQDPQALQANVLYARGTGQFYRAGSSAQDIKVGSTLQKGDWILTGNQSEFEVSVRTPGISDGVLRLGSNVFLVIEQDELAGLPELTVRIYGGQVSFFLPQIAQSRVRMVTPVGALESRSGLFSLTITPQGQLLVNCREGVVLLVAPELAEAHPGQVLTVDYPAGARLYSLSPDDAATFQDRWLKVNTEEASEFFSAEKDTRIVQWQTTSDALNRWSTSGDTTAGVKTFLLPQESLTVWMTQARSVLGDNAGLVSSDQLQNQWKQLSLFRSQLVQKPAPWSPPAEFPGLLGVAP